MRNVLVMVVGAVLASLMLLLITTRGEDNTAELLNCWFGSPPALSTVHVAAGTKCE